MGRIVFIHRSFFGKRAYFAPFLEPCPLLLHQTILRSRKLKHLGDEGVWMLLSCVFDWWSAGLLILTIGYLDLTT